jgi:hypothetical protein
LLTVTTTLRQQGRDIWQFLEQAWVTHHRGCVMPSLLPDHRWHRANTLPRSPTIWVGLVCQGVSLSERIDLLMGLNQLIQCRKHFREANSELFIQQRKKSQDRKTTLDRSRGEQAQ